MTKKEKKAQKELLRSTMTVKDLIKYLGKVSGDIPVGTIGHYGEFVGMSAFHFDVSKSHFEQMGGNPEFWVLNIVPVDIGPEPD